MSAALSHPWPGSRILAGWQPFFTRWQPHGLWLHHLLLHRLEALVAVVRPPALDRLTRLLLEALRVNPAATADLAVRLALDRGFLDRLLADLHDVGLAHADATAKCWMPTVAGLHALANARPLGTAPQRRSFWFALDSDLATARFLPLADPPTSPRELAAAPFDLRQLRDCLDRSDDWKQAVGFPLDVRDILDSPTPENGRRVVVDRPEQMTALFVQTENDRLLAFAVKPPSWQIMSEKPILQLGASWREVLPSLTVEPPLEAWRESWRAWAQPRALPLPEVDACTLERVGIRLRVGAPISLLERLRASRSDAFKGEAWLLAGRSATTRSLAQIELSGAVRPPT